MTTKTKYLLKQLNKSTLILQYKRVLSSNQRSLIFSLLALINASPLQSLHYEFLISFYYYRIVMKIVRF